MKTGLVFSFWVTLVGVLFSGPVMSQALPKVLIAQDSATPGVAHSSEIGSGAEQAVNAAIREKYPCLDVMDMDSVRDYLRFSKDRQVLGTPGSEQDLANLAGSMGRQFLIHITSRSIGQGKVQVSGTVISVQRANALTMHGAVVDDDDDAWDSVAKFANDFAAKIEIPGAKCPTGLSGTVVVTQQSKGSGKKPLTEEPYSWESSMQLNCRLDGSGDPAECEASINSSMKGKDGEFTETGSGNPSCSIDAEVMDDQVRVKVGSCKLKTRTTFRNEAGSGDGESETELGGIEAEGPVGNSEIGEISGSWSDPTGSGLSVTWTLSSH